MSPVFRVGTAAWTLPKDFAGFFGSEGSHLERYASRLNSVEVNSSFYRDHQPKTYARWSQTVPSDFRFAVKFSRLFTHQQKLAVYEEEVGKVLIGLQELKERLGVILVQLPPSLAFDAEVADHFFITLRRHYEGGVAFEPRHASWTGPEAVRLLKEYSISRVWADPDPCPCPGFTSELAYFRLHGSPEMYRSRYEPAALRMWAERIREAARYSKELWCIFDNTTFGFATLNALEMRELLEQKIYSTLTVPA